MALTEQPISQNLEILHLLTLTPPKVSKNFTFIDTDSSLAFSYFTTQRPTWFL
ncbi:hypothetical protein MTR_2g094190 [Medicago truncatula]|uniref:Uncharacterized protein n=1 Tax=Medicago truncatula TaxID=3880 RepID=G7IRR7_MEDTR|nr:hypothetical protein MTR_2g094190 [Medicago truncatula]